jgi:hypothetical protein
MKRISRATVLFALAISGCSGTIIGMPFAQPSDSLSADVPSYPESKRCDPASAHPSARRVWLLTQPQYEKSLRLALRQDLPLASIHSSGYEGTRADLLRLGRSDVVTVHTNAELAGKWVRGNAGSFASCDVSQSPCARELIAGLARRLFRRPVSDEMMKRLLELYEIGKETSAERGLELVVTAMAESPRFLYRLELGNERATQNVAALSAHELADAIAYSLVDSAPDDELSRVADDGSLLSPETLRSQVERLAQTPEGHATFARFVDALVGGQSVMTLQKDRMMYPQFDADLARSMRQDTNLFARALAADENATLSDLFTLKAAFLDERLAQVYGVTGIRGTVPQRVALDRVSRQGVLTQPLFLATHAQPDHVVPTTRGRFILNALLCQSIPQPPVIDPRFRPRTRC